MAAVLLVFSNRMNASAIKDSNDYSFIDCENCGGTRAH